MDFFLEDLFCGPLLKSLQDIVTSEVNQLIRPSQDFMLLQVAHVVWHSNAGIAVLRLERGVAPNYSAFSILNQDLSN